MILFGRWKNIKEFMYVNATENDIKININIIVNKIARKRWYQARCLLLLANSIRFGSAKILHSIIA